MDNNFVFINCPFDDEYYPLLRSILFTCCKFNLHPQISETLNAVKSRIATIQEMMQNSKYSIHNLSRNRSKSKDEFARFNMPFELGMDYILTKQNPLKAMIIFDKNPHDYDKFLSDLSGSDIQTHNNDITLIVKAIRNWLIKYFPEGPSYSEIIDQFNLFESDFIEKMITLKLDINNPNDIPKHELIKLMYAYINATKP
jgi:hypothetical protein